MKFEWDETKAESNYKKHQVRFEEAQTVFLDSRAIEFFDVVNSDNETHDEDRFVRIGISLKMNILIIVFCERDENLIRIISARRATKTERRIYEEGV